MRLIDADVLEEQFGISDEDIIAKEIIGNAPTIDAVLVAHGHWVHLGGDEWCCSNCGDVIHTEGSWERPTGKYCAECGAKMDEVK